MKAKTRAYDLEFDTHVEVALNPHGAWLTIQCLESQRDESADRIEELEAKLEKAAARLEWVRTQEETPPFISLLVASTLKELKGKTDDQ